MGAGDIAGKVSSGNAVEQAAIAAATRMKPDYLSHEVTVPGGGFTDESLKNDQSAIPSGSRIHTVIIRTDQDITLKLNKNTNPVISLSSTERTITLDVIEITDIFVTAPAGTKLKFLMI